MNEDILRELIAQWSRDDAVPLSFAAGLNLANRIMSTFPQLAGAAPWVAHGVTQNVWRFVVSQQKIKAIKEQRSDTGQSLKSAKDVIDRIWRDLKIS